MQRILPIFIGSAGLLGVGLGAFGAHAFSDTLKSNNATEIWQIAVVYHLIHVVALFALAGWVRNDAKSLPPQLAGAAICWMAGILLFSGSLYGLALGAPRMIGALTPVGGLFLLTGWMLVMLGGWQYRNKQKPSH